MNSNRKKQHNRRLFSHLDYFDQDVNNGDEVNSSTQEVVVNSGPADHEISVNNFIKNPVTNEITVNVQTLGKCLTEKID